MTYIQMDISEFIGNSFSVTFTTIPNFPSDASKYIAKSRFESRFLSLIEETTSASSSLISSNVIQ